MFDPTIFDNLKVAVENYVYDMDNLDARVVITHRIDRLEMAVMARVFALQFTLAEGSGITAEIRLESSLKDLAAEILEQDGAAGCAVRLRFYMPVDEVESACAYVEQQLTELWQTDMPPTQMISYLYGEGAVPSYQNEIEVHFNRKINEEQMEDLPGLIEHMVQTLETLEAFAGELA
ncbi:hypothetical protein [Paenibacillus sacheonensis]|uniref:Uncharacterized protein n=1 Tax=Paenibacillus sacheonensis TaxID=742054 RepID=A0A7X4YLD0_9BACL|nr:hypothetical protein [Paenibacillus sacheonensis]MBM7568344.1 hypothetical protein [Paenibacillus sacheonensis]NBC68473.1 hypothetical protein [Paenibacillus sacheonensis]